MRTDIMTKETFDPVHDEQYFASEETFHQFVESQDELEELTPVKKEINWKPQKRVDPKTGEKFLAYHPAQIYAHDPKEEQKAKKPKQRKAPNEYFEDKVKDCQNCGQNFIATAPAMKYCENCSEKGGKLLTPSK